MIKAAKRPIRLIGYCRVSTDEQARNGESLSVQRSRILMYCQQGHVPIELVDIIEDAGLSGKKWDRPGFQRIIAMLKAGMVDGVVVSRLDRLSRTVRHVLKLVEEVFIPRDLHLLSVNEQVDTRTPMGKAMLSIMAVLGQLEREQIAARVQEVLQAKIEAGQRVGAVRYGYDLAPDGKTLVENAAEQAIIVQMRGWRSAGWSYRDISGTLNRMGVQSKTGGKWTHTAVARILGRKINPAKAGAA